LSRFPVSGIASFFRVLGTMFGTGTSNRYMSLRQEGQQANILDIPRGSDEAGIVGR
jgi:hypothetical protein